MFTRPPFHMSKHAPKDMLIHLINRSTVTPLQLTSASCCWVLILYRCILLVWSSDRVKDTDGKAKALTVTAKTRDLLIKDKDKATDIQHSRKP